MILTPMKAQNLNKCKVEANFAPNEKHKKTELILNSLFFNVTLLVPWSHLIL